MLKPRPTRSATRKRPNPNPWSKIWAPPARGRQARLPINQPQAGLLLSTDFKIPMLMIERMKADAINDWPPIPF